jgi:hypothetical protein
MKTFFTLLIFFSISISASSQQFQWADAYEIDNCNEVAALSVDTSGNIFIAGVYDAPVFVPYFGDAYLQKTDPDGEVLWIEYLMGTVHIGDMAAVGNDVIIVGQSNGPFSYKGVEYGTGPYFAFVVMIDGDGNLLWHFTDDTKYGVYSNISVGNTGTTALHIRNQSNLGDWIIIVDTGGNIQNTKLLSASHTLAVDIAYYDDQVYINGGFSGQGSITIDTIVIEQPSVEHAVFVLALDENLMAAWLSPDTTINNNDGRIVANASGVYSYQAVLRTPFNVFNLIKKFTPDGQLLVEIEPPIFSNAVAMYPDLVATPSMVGMFTENSFSFNSHKVILFDHDLNVLSEKVIDGPSSGYSGQVSNHGDDIFVAHVFSGDLNFNNELTLAYPGGTGKLPYIAKIDNPMMTGTANDVDLIIGLQVYPNPADELITVRLYGKQFYEGSFSVTDLKGKMVKNGGLNQNTTSIDISRLPAGVYILQADFTDGSKLVEKVFVR